MFSSIFCVYPHVCAHMCVSTCKHVHVHVKKLADCPFAIIAVGNGHVQGSRCPRVFTCVCVHMCVPTCVFVRVRVRRL